MEVIITKSKNSSKKKYDARIDGTKTVSFGEKGASDFTKHKNTDRKERYIAVSYTHLTLPTIYSV